MVEKRLKMVPNGRLVMEEGLGHECRTTKEPIVDRNERRKLGLVLRRIGVGWWFDVE